MAFKGIPLFNKLKVMSPKKKIIISVLSVLLISGLAGFSIYSNYQYNKYINLASDNLNNENFTEAINDYKLAGEYNSKYDYNNDINNANNLRTSKSNYTLGIEDFNKKNYTKALDEFKNVISKDKNRYSDALKKIEISQNEVVKSNLDLVKENIQKEKYDIAIIYLNVILKVQPNNQEASKLLTQCNDEIAKIKAKADAQTIETARVIAKTQGVTIGMTQQQVLDSSWGKPDQINKTTNAYGVSEQWVYFINSPKMNFLYFDNGILTSIQN